MRMKIAEKGKRGECHYLEICDRGPYALCHKYQTLFEQHNENDRCTVCMEATGGKALYMVTEDELKEVE